MRNGFGLIVTCAAATATLGTFSTQAASFSFDTNLVQHHTFDVDVSDAFGRTSTAVGGATISGSGAAVGSGSLALDGTGAVDLGAKASLDGLNSFTVSSWVQLNSFDGANRDFAAVFASDGWGGGHLHINFSDNAAFGGGTQLTAASPQSVAPAAGVSELAGRDVPTEWLHFAVVVDGVNIALYVDGDLQESGTISAAGAIDLGLAAQIGAYADLPDRTLTGNIDDFRIYDIALTESQIGELAVPEPGSLALLGLGGLLIARRRR